MGCSVFLYLLLSGLCTLCPCLPRHYHFVSITKNWSEAQSYCREKYTDLATFDNEEEVKKAIDTAGSVAETAWIGLYDNISRWRWSMADRDFYREGETEFRNWKDGEPNNLDGAENCAETYKINNGKWFDTNCSKRNFFICYNGSAVSNQNYILVQIEKNWTEAQIHCREHYTDLVSVRNQAENEKIKTRNDELPDGKGVWIGLFRDSWKWSDQGNSSFRYWKPGYPDSVNENCVQQRLTDDKRWENRECSERKPFFCYEDNLILIQENMTWGEALNYCRENNSDLVSIHSLEIQRLVEMKLGKASTAHVWLGLRFTCVLNFWFWVSAESTCYHNWASGNGTGYEECGSTGAVESGGNHLWVSLPETTKLNFLCFKYAED